MCVFLPLRRQTLPSPNGLGPIGVLKCEATLARGLVVSTAVLSLQCAIARHSPWCCPRSKSGPGPIPPRLARWSQKSHRQHYIFLLFPSLCQGSGCLHVYPDAGILDSYSQAPLSQSRKVLIMPRISVDVTPTHLEPMATILGRRSPPRRPHKQQHYVLP